MSIHGRGGSDQSHLGRRQTQSLQQRRLSTGSLAPTQGHPPPLPVTLDIPPVAAYPEQYGMTPQLLTMAPTPPFTFDYPPPFRVQMQPQSMHGGYPTPAAYHYPPNSALYPQQPSSVYGPYIHYASPMVHGYAPYAPEAVYSPLYAHQQRMYPDSSYPQFAHAPGSVPQGEGGTWWFVPASQPQHQNRALQQHQQYEAGTSAYPFYPAPLTDQPLDIEYPAPPTSLLPSSLTSSPVPPLSRNPAVRHAYHPSPPEERSKWVMWVGNVPSDAVHDELWRFFTQPAESGGLSSRSTAPSTSTLTVIDSGVLSIFLISRSSCAFVNYETEAHLLHGIARCNDVPMRTDPRCASLVCRVRSAEDDLRAGVGGQRGMGMHVRWVKAKAERLEKEAGEDGEDSEPTISQTSDPAHLLSPSASPPLLGPSVEVSRARDAETSPSLLRRHGEGSDSNSSGSFASTTSSLLQRNFPQRLFILKSLTLDNLDLSVRTGVWATQKHNEVILDRAFRNSKEIFLVFSVNKSGEFYGYARLAGPVGPSVEPLVVDSLPMPLQPVSERGIDGAGEKKDMRVQSRGQDFDLQWICTERLPFPRTQHLRNPWNQDREIKVSRDGTELEPSVGVALLEEWRLSLLENL